MVNILYIHLILNKQSSAIVYNNITLCNNV